MTRALFLGALLLFGCSGERGEPFDDGSNAAGDDTLEERLPYPSAPFGSVRGATIANYRFLGWNSPLAADLDVNALEPVSLAHFYDPSGAKGIKYLVITSTAVWCSACKAEYRDMASKVASYRKRGVEFMGALFEDNDSGPARPADLKNWANAYDVAFPFVLDPQLKLGVFFNREATPMVMVVDAENMQILRIEEGWASTGPSALWTYLETLPNL